MAWPQGNSETEARRERKLQFSGHSSVQDSSPNTEHARKRTVCLMLACLLLLPHLCCFKNELGLSSPAAGPPDIVAGQRLGDGQKSLKPSEKAFA